MRRLRILTWHVHGSYLYYLSHAGHEFYVPFDRMRTPGYTGTPPGYPWPDNLKQVPVEELKTLGFDCILFQAKSQLLEDQHRFLSAEQRRLPKIYLEHDPPREHPTDTVHPASTCGESSLMLVHVTHFNQLMWDNGDLATRVVEHGVTDARSEYDGRLERGIVIINHISTRGRRLGADVHDRMRRQVPLDLVGMGYEDAGGIGEIPHPELPRFMANYRFFFNPIRYTSLGLSICEAMMVGMPVVGLATTELSTVVRNGVSGFIGTNERELVEGMRLLLRDRDLAISQGREARKIAKERFSIERFVQDWNGVFKEAAC